MKKLQLIFLLLLSYTTWANMAEPVTHGTEFGSPFTSNYVDVLHETIYVTVDSIFQTAKFDITYEIEAEKDGLQIPLLFIASKAGADFTISIDGQNIELMDTPSILKEKIDGYFGDFSHVFEHHGIEGGDLVLYNEDGGDYGGRIYKFSDLYYFEIDIAKGRHKIEVDYTANVWEDRWGEIKKYYFKYFLSPAKYWKSFGDLRIIVDNKAFGEVAEINLGAPNLQDGIFSMSDSHYDEWFFEKLPGNVLRVEFNPEMPQGANSKIKILKSTINLFYALLSLGLLFFMWRYRKKSDKFVNPFAVFGSFLLPTIFLFIELQEVHWIDDLIGEHASKEHGYLGLFVVVVSFFGVLVMLGISALVDMGMKYLKTQKFFTE